MKDTKELRWFVRSFIEKEKLGELSKLTGVSKSYLSMFADGRAKWNTAKLEAKLRVLRKKRSLSFRDERRLLKILEILDECSDRESVIAQLADGA